MERLGLLLLSPCLRFGGLGFRVECWEFMLFVFKVFFQTEASSLVSFALVFGLQQASRIFARFRVWGSVFGALAPYFLRPRNNTVKGGGFKAKIGMPTAATKYREP